jgi:alcohol dehydrogenase (cytochrome c)/quinohemoprotein ethanol dehydrogenase
LLVFKLGAKGSLPAPPPVNRMPLDPPVFRGTEAQVKTGGYAYGRYCGTCHGDAGIAGTIVPDLRRSAALSDKATWTTIVADGALKANGMIGWKQYLSAEEIESVRQYLIKRANEDKALGER